MEIVDFLKKPDKYKSIGADVYKRQPVIRRVYEQVTGVLPDAVVATDDERILRAVEEFGGRAVMTSAEHRSGTDRCWEAYGKLGREYDLSLIHI